MTIGSTRRIASVIFDRDQVEHCLELWYIGRFNTYDIARYLRMPEHAVCRVLQAARDVARMEVLS